MRARTRAAATVSAVVVAVGTTLLIAAPSVTAAPSSNPAWEPDSNAVGKVTLLNASAQPVTSGKTTDSPIAAAAVASGSGTSGDTKATLYAYTPTTQSPANWDCHDTLMGPSDYTSTPTAKGSAGDLSLASFITECPNKTTDAGHAGYYQLRLVTSGVGHQADPTTGYYAVDIFVSGNTWTLASNVKPKVLTNTRKPTVVGVHKVGKKQTCKPGAWSPAASSYSYGWFASGRKIAGATHSTFTPKKALAGKTLSCLVTAHKSGYPNASAKSASVKISK